MLFCQRLVPLHFQDSAHDILQDLADREGFDHKWPQCLVLVYSSGSRQRLIQLTFHRLVCGHAKRNYTNHPVRLGPNLIHDTLFLTCEHDCEAEGGKRRVDIVHAAL